MKGLMMFIYLDFISSCRALVNRLFASLLSLSSDEMVNSDLDPACDEQGVRFLSAKALTYSL